MLLPATGIYLLVTGTRKPFLLDSKYNLKRDPVLARKLLEYNHRLEDHVSSIMLSRWYLKDEGGGVKRDASLSILNQLSAQGITVADIELGDRHYYGQGVDKDESVALRHYQKAARKDVSLVLREKTLKIDGRRSQLLQTAANAVAREAVNW